MNTVSAEMPIGNERMTAGCPCPHCGNYIKNYHPEKVQEECSCNKCGYEWVSRVDNPQRCPSCGSYRWNKDSLNVRCVKCNHNWTTRSGKSPERCPRCKTRAWQSSEVQKKGRQSKKISNEKREVELLKNICHKYEEGAGCRDISETTGEPLLRVVIAIRENLRISQPRL